MQGQEDELMAFTRRLLRSPRSLAAITADLSAIFNLREDPLRLRMHQSLMRDMAARAGGDTFVVRTGDVAIVVPPAGSAGGEALADDIADLLSKDTGLPVDTLRKRITMYPLPDQFWQFRSWVARYHGGGSLGATNPAAAVVAPGTEEDKPLRGRMTAEMLSRIEQRILRCDIRDVVRQQPVCRRPGTARQKWQPIIQERFLAIETLRSRFFPGVELARHGPLFQEFCLILDERLIHHLLSNRLDPGIKTSINISVDSALAPMIDLLGKRIDDGSRDSLMFEISCVEFLGDVERGQRAIARLRDYGFGVVLDGLAIPTLPYLRADRVDCDLIKIQFARDQIPLFASSACVKTMRKLPAEKIVFSRCDHESAIDVGATLGVALYQGWLIDRLCAF
jgi:EAL domain-containing protein (putative c-di-GMP-specific phosphodiesterase class I)